MLEWFFLVSGWSWLAFVVGLFAGALIVVFGTRSMSDATDEQLMRELVRRRREREIDDTARAEVEADLDMFDAEDPR